MQWFRQTGPWEHRHVVRFDLPAFPDLYRTRPLGIRPRTAYYLWFELTALCDDGTKAYANNRIDADSHTLLRDRLL